MVDVWLIHLLMRYWKIPLLRCYFWEVIPRGLLLIVIAIGYLPTTVQWEISGWDLQDTSGISDITEEYTSWIKSYDHMYMQFHAVTYNYINIIFKYIIYIYNYIQWNTIIHAILYNWIRNKYSVQSTSININQHQARLGMHCIVEWKVIEMIRPETGYPPVNQQNWGGCFCQIHFYSFL